MAYYGDFDNQAEEERQYQLQQEQNYMDEFGACPNCGEGVHVTELGSTDGVTYCIHCRPLPKLTSETL